MKNHIFYETATGRIVKTRHGTGADPIPPTGQTVMEGVAGPDTHYVLSGSLAPRPVPNLAPLAGVSLGVAVTLTGLPEGAVVTATPEGGDVETDTVGSNGEMEITFATAGAYRVYVSEVFPHRSASITVEVS